MTTGSESLDHTLDAEYLGATEEYAESVYVFQPRTELKYPIQRLRRMGSVLCRGSCLGCRNRTTTQELQHTQGQPNSGRLSLS